MRAFGIAAVLLLQLATLADAATRAEVVAAAANQKRAYLQSLQRRPVLQRLAAESAAERELPAPLRAAGEPPLRVATRNRQFNGYRLHWQFLNGDYISVRLRVAANGSGQVLSREKHSGQTLSTAKNISNSDVALLQAYIRIANFWRTPAIAFDQNQIGTRLTLEGAQNGNYRWLSAPNNRDIYLHDVAMRLCQLAGLNQLSTPPFLNQ
jgi:hypothetical protein